MPRGPIRDVYCDFCRNEVENSRPSKDACKECKSARNSAKRKKLRAEAGKPPYGSGQRDPRCCLCGNIKDNVDSGYCSACKRETARLRRLKDKESPTFMEDERARKKARYQENEYHRLKIATRVFTYRAIKSGILLRQPCEVCGKLKVDAHHDDYTKPLDVRWLCRKHHNEHHRNEIN